MPDSLSHCSGSWLGLMIGNSRLHWARFVDHQLQETWDTPHADPSGALTNMVSELWIASVVPAQSQIWQFYPRVRFLQLEQIPVSGLYPTLGIDRALAVWGAIATVGSPVLVIDAGTALTFTGADQAARLVGGAILPGLRLQLQALNQETAALPLVSRLASPSGSLPLATPLPPRWALNTPEAIASGVIHTLVAGIQSFMADWWQRFPESAVVLTGGDSKLLHQCLNQQVPAIAARIRMDPHVIFRGMQAIVG